MKRLLVAMPQVSGITTFLFVEVSISLCVGQAYELELEKIKISQLKLKFQSRKSKSEKLELDLGWRLLVKSVKTACELAALVLAMIFQN